MCFSRSFHPDPKNTQSKFQSDLKTVAKVRSNSKKYHCYILIYLFPCLYIYLFIRWLLIPFYAAYGGMS